MNKTCIFGYELLLDCYDCRPRVCSDLDHCYKFLDKLVEFIGMDKQEEPTIFRTNGKRFPGKEGLSGWVPLAQSSIVIHTLSKHNFISVDVYSCGQFDKKKVVTFVRKYFSPKKIEAQYLLRGKHYFCD
ncbi:S-adenosylmethionine decarboxylase [Candidatus Woesearchaeota archaeon]|nr:S-adenosylmethionine decarboxylase [Candidatus Woesearchaeota archaeon]